MKKKLILGSALGIIMCSSLITGATMALFTSESNVNIAVTTGKVDVTATATEVTTYSMGVQTQDGTFDNGGTAKVEGGELILDKVTPGDKAVVALEITNNSNVAHQQRISLTGSLGAELMDQLIVGVSETDSNFTYYSDYTTAWTKVDAVTEPDTTTMYVSIELPAYVGDDWQDKSCEITISVEAVQGNADVTSTTVANEVYLVNNQEELTNAIAEMQSGETVILYGGVENWATADIEYTEVKEITVRGYKVGTMTINAPNGTINLYNDVNTLNVEAIAGNSLHIYGNIVGATIESGRAVVETGASVDNVTVEPSAEANATVEVKSQSKVASISSVPQSGSEAIIVVEKDAVIPTLNVGGEGETKLDNSGIVENTQGEGTLVEGAVSAESFLAKLAEGGEVKLASDLMIEGGNVKVSEGITVNIDLGGNTLTVDTNSALLNYGTIENLVNGSIIGGNYYGIVNYGNIGNLNVNVKALGSSSMAAIYNYSIIDEISGGEYLGHSGSVYEPSITGSVGLYNSTDAVVKLISGGYFQGSSVAFRNYNKNGIESVTGGFFDCPYMDENGKTFCDNTTIGNVFYNNAPLSVTGGTWYNVGTKINSKLGEGYTLVQGDVCEMTSYKTYTSDRLWEDSESGNVYYYYWVMEDVEVNSAEEFISEITSGGAKAIKLNADISILDTVSITSGNFVLNMNGKTITYSADETREHAVIDLYEAAQLTIVGNGIFTFDNSYFNANDSIGYTFRLTDDAKLTINDGYYYAGLTCVQLDENSQCIINGGTFEAAVNWNNVYWILNLIDGCDGVFSVKGGTFKNYDPSNSQTENPVANFVAKGYKVISEEQENGDILYTVVPEETAE